MAIPIGKMVPTLVVLGVVGYCCWSEAEPPAGVPAKETGQRGEIPPALLSPAGGPIPKQDPFRVGQADPKAGSVLEKPAAAPEKSAPSATAPASAADLAKQVSNLVLRGTFIQGNRRVALINDRLCAEGGGLSLAKGSGPSYLLAQVYPDKVVLQHEGQSVELKYPNREKKPGPSPRVAGSASGSNNDRSQRSPVTRTP